MSLPRSIASIKNGWPGDIRESRRREETVRHPAARKVDLDRESIWISYCAMFLESRESVALSTGIGSDTQRPFAVVIVAGLISRLFIGFLVNPVLCEMVAREGDVLQVGEGGARAWVASGHCTAEE